jgi:hypothetical protein
MRHFARAALAVLTLSVLVAVAASGPTFAQAPGQYSAVPPAGHEAFFKAVGELAKMYPESAKRFGLRDRQVVPEKPEELLRIRSSGRCPSGQTCGFWCWPSAAALECCECDPLLK